MTIADKQPQSVENDLLIDYLIIEQLAQILDGGYPHLVVFEDVALQ